MSIPRCATASPAEIKLEAIQNTERQQAPTLPYRVGHGFDLHRLEEGPYKLILGGLEIPHDRGCVAHSDGKKPLCIVCPHLTQGGCEPNDKHVQALLLFIWSL